MEKIHVKKSHLVTEKGKIILKGVSIPDIYWLKQKEYQNSIDVLKIIKKLGFNTIRLPILPGHFLFYKNVYFEKIEEIVELCLSFELYCILDWHAIGNPLHNETRLQKYYHEKDNKKIFWYLSDKKIALDYTLKLVKKFGEYSNVLFEIFNEPCPAEKNIEELELSALPFLEWRKIAVDLINIIRNNSENLIIVSSNYWSFNLKDTAKKPYTEFENIAYSFHNYPIKNNKKWEEMLESMKEYPIIVTEFGYDIDENSQYYSTYEEYLKPFMSYLISNNISWIGWCFSASWRPRIIKTWKPLELSDFGKNLYKTISNDI